MTLSVEIVVAGSGMRAVKVGTIDFPHILFSSQFHLMILAVSESTGLPFDLRDEIFRSGANRANGTFLNSSHPCENGPRMAQ